MHFKAPNEQSSDQHFAQDGLGMRGKDKQAVREAGCVFTDLFSSMTLSFCVTFDHCLMLCGLLLFSSHLQVGTNEQEFCLVVLVKYARLKP